MSYSYFRSHSRGMEAASRALRDRTQPETPDVTIHRLEQALNSAQAHIACLRTELDLIATSQEITTARAIARRALGK